MLLNDENMRNYMGDNAIEFFNERFLLKKIVHKHENVYLQNN